MRRIGFSSVEKEYTVKKKCECCGKILSYNLLLDNHRFCLKCSEKKWMEAHLGRRSEK